MSPLHVCVFTTAHPWDDVRVKSKFVDSFLDAGARVTWVGPNSSFFVTAADRDPRVDYRLVEGAPGWSGRLKRFNTLAQTLRSVHDIDVIYTPDPDAAALALASRKSGRIVFDIHEEYHKGHFVSRLPAPAAGLAAIAVKKTIALIARRCDLVTSVNQAILDAYRARPGQSLVTFNTPPDWFRRPAAVPNHRIPRIFHGKTLAGNGTPVLLEAARRLQEKNGEVKFLMFAHPKAGAQPYDPTFAAAVEDLGVADSLDLREAVTHRDMPTLMSESSIGLISYDRTLGEGSLPNRFFEYMALGIPVIVPEYSPLMRAIVESEQIGWTADFEDPHSIASAIELALSDPRKLHAAGQRAEDAFREHYSWGPIFDQFRRRLTPPA